MKFAHWLALFVAGALVAVGCGEDRGASSTSTSTNETSTSSTSSEPEVEVGLKEWKVIVEAPSVGAGHVKFDADNEGKVPHELVVLKTDTRAADLKVQGGKAKPEGETVGHIADVAPG